MVFKISLFLGRLLRKKEISSFSITWFAWCSLVLEYWFSCTVQRSQQGFLLCNEKTNHITEHSQQLSGCLPAGTLTREQTARHWMHPWSNLSKSSGRWIWDFLTSFFLWSSTNFFPLLYLQCANCTFLHFQHTSNHTNVWFWGKQISVEVITLFCRDFSN